MINVAEKKHYLLFLIVIATALLIQGAAIRRPFLGHFASYQATVMASISRNMMRENFSQPLLPKTDLIIGGERSLHLNQYPFPSLVAALGERVFGGGLEFWGRFQAIFFNLLSIVLIGLMGAHFFGSWVGWLSSILYALSPYSLIYGQSFMSEPMSIFFLLLSICFLILIRQSRMNILLTLGSALSFSIAVTGRVHFILFYPICLAYLFFKGGLERKMLVIVFGLLALLMPAAWYGYTYFAALHAHNVHTNLFLQLGSPKGNKVVSLLNPEYFKRILDIVSQNMLTPLLFPFLFFGGILAKKQKAGFWFTMACLFAGFATALLAPVKVMAHDFYLYASFPFMILIAACGLAPLFEAFPVLKKSSVVVFLLTLYLGVSSRYFFHPIFKHAEEENNILTVARFVQQNTDANDRLIVAGKNPAILFYYVDRAAWSMELDAAGTELPSYQKNPTFSGNDIEEVKRLEEAMKNPISWLEYLKNQGASYIVIQGRKDLENNFPDFLDYLQQHYTKVTTDSVDFYLFRLKEPVL